VPSIVLRPTFYVDNFLGPWIRPGIETNGVLAFPLPSGFEMSWVSADEVAAFAVAALGRADLAGSVIDIGGPEPLSGDNIARCFSAALGRTIQYVPISPDEYENALVPIFGQSVAFEVAAQIRCIITQGTGAVEMDATYREFGVEPIPLPAWIKAHWHST
jgi:NAD(P)H dehydrogenase (quinone)